MEKENRVFYISSTILNNLPTMVKNELSKMPEDKQREFAEEYDRKSKSILVAYLLLIFIFAVHYGYLGKWGLQVIFWLTGGGLFIWWFIDLFRLPGLIRDYNKDVAVEVMNNLKHITS